MVAPVQITQSSVPLKIPVAAELLEGGLAVNLIDGALYSKRNDGSIIRIEGDTGNGTIASGASIALGAVMAGVVDVTGAATIATIVLRDGQTRTVRFTGAPTLTHSATLVLPGGASIVAVAGDFATFRGYAGGVVRCVTYGFGSIAVEIYAATGKTTPVDADALALVDSAAGNVLKKLTWASLKATLASWIGGNLIAGSFTTLQASTTTTIAQTLLTSGAYLLFGKSTNNILRVFPQTDPSGVELAATDSTGVVAFKPLAVVANGLTLSDSSGTGKIAITAAGASVTGGFGCNGKAAQTSVSVGAAAIDLPTALALVNNLRTMAINNGTAA